MKFRNLTFKNFSKLKDVKIHLWICFNSCNNRSSPRNCKRPKAVSLIKKSVHIFLHSFSWKLVLDAFLVIFLLRLVHVKDKLLHLPHRKVSLLASSRWCLRFLIWSLTVLDWASFVFNVRALCGHWSSQIWWASSGILTTYASIHVGWRLISCFLGIVSRMGWTWSHDLICRLLFWIQIIMLRYWRSWSLSLFSWSSNLGGFFNLLLELRFLNRLLNINRWIILYLWCSKSWHILLFIYTLYKFFLICWIWMHWQWSYKLLHL